MAAFNVTDLWMALSKLLLTYGLHTLVAIAVWIGGRWLISLLQHVLVKGFSHFGQIDQPLARSLGNIIALLLNFILILIILGIFGIDTSSLAAVLIGFGVALGISCGGILVHVIAGIFLQSTRPWKVGDDIEIAGVRGRVLAQGLLSTTIKLANGSEVAVGNQHAYSRPVTLFSKQNLQRISATLHLKKETSPARQLQELKEYVAKEEKLLVLQIKDSDWQLRDVDTHSFCVEIASQCELSAADQMQQILQLTLLQWQCDFKGSSTNSPASAKKIPPPLKL